VPFEDGSRSGLDEDEQEAGELVKQICWGSDRGSKNGDWTLMGMILEARGFCSAVGHNGSRSGDGDLWVMHFVGDGDRSEDVDGAERAGWLRTVSGCFRLRIGTFAEETTTRKARPALEMEIVLEPSADVATIEWLPDSRAVVLVAGGIAVCTAADLFVAPSGLVMAETTPNCGV
jgi:hypothetical protein